MLELVRGGRASDGPIRVLYNLGDRAVRVPADASGTRRGEAAVLLRSEADAYGGDRREAGPADELAPFEFLVLGPPSWRAFPGR